MFGLTKAPQRVRIRMLTSLVTTGVPDQVGSGASFQRGDITTWDAEDAKRLIERGLAELVEIPAAHGK